MAVTVLLECVRKTLAQCSLDLDKKEFAACL